MTLGYIIHETWYIRFLFDKYKNKFLNTRTDFLEPGSIYIVITSDFYLLTVYSIELAATPANTVAQRLLNSLQEQSGCVTLSEQGFVSAYQNN